jgi:hypothetical protein
VSDDRLAMSARWWDRFELQPDGCRLWTGATNRAGYGRSKGNGSAKGETYVHRIVYALTIGPIPEGLDVDHDCHNRDKSCRDGSVCRHRRCGEPTHLRAATRAQNRADARRSHCRYGHPMDSRRRNCLVCNREAQRRFRQEVLAGERKPPPSWIRAGYRDKTAAGP